MKLADLIPFARKPTATAAQPLYSETAVRRALGVIGALPDPDEALRRAGVTRDRLRALEYDDEVSQCLDTRREAVIGTPWRLEPDNTRLARRLTEILEPHMVRLVSGAWEAVPYGYSVVEVVYRRREDGVITVDRLGSKPLEWFHYDQTRGWVFRQDGGLDGLAIDPRKFLVTVRGGSLRQPYGEPLLSRLWFPVTWRLEGWSHWLHYLEAFGMPMVLGQVVDYQGFVDAMAAQGVRTAVGWQAHPDDRVTTIHASGAGEFERLERALTTRIQRLILGQTLTSDVGDSGSYAAAKVHNDVRDDKRLADLRMVSGTVQQLADAICELNGWNAAPRVVFADDTGLEVQRAERDKTLQDALAASGLRLTLNYYTDRYDLSDEDLEPAPDASPPLPSEPPGDDRGDAGMVAAPPHQFRPAQRFTPVQQAIEDEVERLAPDLEWPVSVEAIRAAIRGARDQADLEERLAAVLGAADDPRLADLLARAQFAAMVLGYVAAEERRT